MGKYFNPFMTNWATSALASAYMKVKTWRPRGAVIVPGKAVLCGVEEMTTIKDVVAKLEQSHVVSFHCPAAGWAGYSQRDGRYWVGEKYFSTAKEAALRMAHFGLSRWIEVDEPIDEGSDMRGVER